MRCQVCGYIATDKVVFIAYQGVGTVYYWCIPCFKSKLPEQKQELIEELN